MGVPTRGDEIEVVWERVRLSADCLGVGVGVVVIAIRHVTSVILYTTNTASTAGKDAGKTKSIKSIKRGWKSRGVTEGRA